MHMDFQGIHTQYKSVAHDSLEMASCPVGKGHVLLSTFIHRSCRAHLAESVPNIYTYEAGLEGYSQVIEISCAMSLCVTSISAQ